MNRFCALKDLDALVTALRDCLLQRRPALLTCRNPHDVRAKLANAHIGLFDFDGTLHASSQWRALRLLMPEAVRKLEDADYAAYRSFRRATRATESLHRCGPLSDTHLAVWETQWMERGLRRYHDAGLTRNAMEQTGRSLRLRDGAMNLLRLFRSRAVISMGLTPLIRSSDLAAPVGTSALGFMTDPTLLRENFKPSGERFTLAARISGKVPSAFAEGAPAGAAAGGKAHLAESASPINVVLVADADLLSDRLWVQTRNLFGQQLNNAFANNGDFVVNALDNLLGSSELIGIRGRAAFSRPFTRVQDLRREAEEKFRVTEERLKAELRDTEQKLGELQARREDRNALIMSPEQEKELERFRDQRVQIRKELRQVQRNLDQDIENLGNWLKAINIGLMPLVTALAGIGLLLLRRQRKSGIKRS